MDQIEPPPDANNLPVPAELVEPSDPAERERQLIEIEAEIESGDFSTHEEVRTWLAELAAGRDVPPPCDR